MVIQFISIILCTQAAYTVLCTPERKEKLTLTLLCMGKCFHASCRD